MRQLYERLPEKVKRKLQSFKDQYKNKMIPKEVTRAAVSGYAAGLRDAGMISDYERGMICVFCATSGFEKEG